MKLSPSEDKHPIQLQHAGSLRQFQAGSPFYQPNGVALLADGRIIVADGGNDRICLLDSDGNGIEAVGRHGFGRYAFKEPVGVFVSPQQQQLFICDWHNHRVVVLDDQLRYVTEFGRYGHPHAKSTWVTLLTFAHSLAYDGSYADRHHNGPPSRRRKRYNLLHLFSGWRYEVQRSGGWRVALRNVLNSNDLLLKPNGVAFATDRIAVSDKDQRAILWLGWKDGQLRLTGTWTGPDAGRSFGRLGNLTVHPSGDLLVCDERNHAIWRLDHQGRLLDQIEGKDSGLGAFLPFSCCLLNEHIVAVCGGLNFQLIDLQHKVVLFCSEPIGELHGIAYNPIQRRVIVCNRSENRIELFDVPTFSL